MLEHRPKGANSCKPELGKSRGVRGTVHQNGLNSFPGFQYKPGVRIAMRVESGFGFAFVVIAVGTNLAIFVVDHVELFVTQLLYIHHLVLGRVDRVD